MPIYEYQCQACGKVNEVMQKIGDAAPDACDSCAKGPLSKLLSKTGFILKGSGWYVTDFRGGSSSKAAISAADGGSSKSNDSGKKDSSSGGGSEAPATSDTKTETKSETKPATGGCASGCGHKH